MTMKKRYALLLLLLIGSLHTQAQIKWSNPLDQPFPVIRGRAWHNEQQGTYARLPLKAKNLVNKAVWNLSQQSAGLSIAFYSNSPEIKIKYTVTGGRSMATCLLQAFRALTFMPQTETVEAAGVPPNTLWATPSFIPMTDLLTKTLRTRATNIHYFYLFTIRFLFLKSE